MLDLHKMPQRIRVELQLQDLLVFAQKLLDSKQAETIPHNLPEFLTISEAADLLKLAKQTLYQLTSRRAIPFYKKNKRIYFKRTELLTWLEEGKQMTQQEFDEALLTRIQRTHKKRDI